MAVAWMGLGLDTWWDELAYKAAQGTSIERGTFILAKLQAHDAAKLKDVLGDPYRDDIPDPMDISRFESEVILRYLGASPEDFRARLAAIGSFVSGLAGCIGGLIGCLFVLVLGAEIRGGQGSGHPRGGRATTTTARRSGRVRVPRKRPRPGSSECPARADGYACPAPAAG